MYPVLFTIGSFQFTSFGAMMALAFLAGGWLFSRELRRRGEDPQRAWDLLWGAAVGGILGAKIYYLLLFWDQTAASPFSAIASRAGLVWYGGLAGGAAGVCWKLRSLIAPPKPYGDAGAPALALGYAIGRLGCFLVGDDYGGPTSLPWGVAFPNGAPPSTAENLRQFGAAVPNSIPGSAVLTVHPTQLYEVGMSLLILAVLWRFRSRLKSPGMILFAYVVLAGAERMVVEVFRAKDDRVFGPLTIAQVISLTLMVLGILGFFSVWKRPARFGTHQVRTAISGN
jgi:phosphatidylglycerol:prolipoprotein diacylglycerol transferase